MGNKNDNSAVEINNYEQEKELYNKNVQSAIASANKHVKDRLKMQKSSIFAIIIVLIILFSLLIGFVWSLRYLLILVGVLVTILFLLRIYIHFYEIERKQKYR